MWGYLIMTMLGGAWGGGGWVGRSSTVIKNSYIYPAQQLVKQGCRQRPVNGQCPVKNRFCPVKSLDGQTICPVVYAGKEKIESFKF